MQIICKKMNKNVCQVAVKKEGIQETVQLITTEALTQLRKLPFMTQKCHSHESLI